MAKKTRKPAKTLHRWRITLIKATPAKYLGYVQAADEKSAVEAAAKEFKISDALRDRLVAEREEW
jgi:hypothetical protein